MISRVRLAIGAVLVAVLVALVGHDLLSSEAEAPAVREERVDAPQRRTPAASAPTAPPTRLLVPGLGLDVPVVPIEMDTDGVLTPPADVQTVGWWQRSATPGAARGQTLITGHSVREGDGAMDRIGELGRGDRVRVRTGGSATDYRATSVEVLSREELAAQAQALFGQQRRDGRLVLVTCTDWDGEAYLSNIVVFADRASAA